MAGGTQTQSHVTATLIWPAATPMAATLRLLVALLVIVSVVSAGRHRNCVKRMENVSNLSRWRCSLCFSRSFSVSSSSYRLNFNPVSGFDQATAHVLSAQRPAVISEPLPWTLIDASNLPKNWDWRSVRTHSHNTACLAFTVVQFRTCRCHGWSLAI